jgi:hypothetical protein
MKVGKFSYDIQSYFNFANLNVIKDEHEQSCTVPTNTDIKGNRSRHHLINVSSETKTTNQR